MNRKLVVLLILIGLFGVVGVTTYGVVTGALNPSDSKSEAGSEVKSALSSEVTSETIKDPNEGVDTSVPETDSETTPSLEGDSEAEYDENGALRKDSKYLDDDQDTVANYYDICPGVDDFSSDCKTDAYTSSDNTADDSKVDENGDPISESTYLDEDGDTVANLYDLCPNVDDFSNDCKIA